MRPAFKSPVVLSLYVRSRYVLSLHLWPYDGRSQGRLGAALLLLATMMLGAPAGAFAAEGASGRDSVHVGDQDFDVFTYRPADCVPKGSLLVFHGKGRNADRYRDDARAFADRQCLVVFAPLFDAKRFPNRRYQRGGIVGKDGPLPRDEWTVGLVSGLVAWARSQVPAGLPVFLFGHSAGGQFLSRVAAFGDGTGVTRIVIANASSYVSPLPGEAVPYGLDGPAGDGRLKRYLEAPVTIYLGADDTGLAHLDDAPATKRQGANRLERGRNMFRAAAAQAEEHGWLLGWRLVEATGVGHSASRMLSAPEAADAFGLSVFGAR